MKRAKRGYETGPAVKTEVKEEQCTVKEEIKEEVKEEDVEEDVPAAATFRVTRSRRVAAQQAPNYAVDSDDDDEDESQSFDEDSAPAPRKRPAKKTAKPGRKPPPPSAVVYDELAIRGAQPAASSESPFRLGALPHDILREVLLALPTRDILRMARVSRTFHAATLGGHFWRRKAVREMGSLVLDERNEVVRHDADAGAWRKYVIERSCRAACPLRDEGPLIQEFWAGVSPWHVMLTCLLCSRTSGSAVVHSAIHQLHERFPTPSSLLQAFEEDEDAAMDETWQIVGPLGMQEQRIRFMRNMTLGYLFTDWPAVGPTALMGIGRFGEDSVRVCCHGITWDVDDCNVNAYAVHLRKAMKAAAAK